MQKKKILILTFYWPPSGGIGVQRWLRFVNHLDQIGWEVVVYTAKNASYPVRDEQLLSKVPSSVREWKTEVPEPNAWISKLLFWKKSKSTLLYKNQQQGGNSKSLVQKFLWYVRGNVFIPDARFLWIKPSIRFLRQQLRKEKFDIIVSTGPPHSMHLIAKQLKKEFDTPWISDFRDPWTSMDYLDEMFLTKKARAKHARLEESVLRNSDKVVVVGRTMYEEFKSKYNIDSIIIWNGYEGVPASPEGLILDKKFTIAHIGSFLYKRNCDDLWKVLAALVTGHKSFAQNLEIKLVGNVATNILESISHFGLDTYLNKIDFVPHEQAKAFQESAQVLLLPIDRIHNAEFVITGKLFEYLKSRRPILMIGPENGDAAEIIDTCKAGYCCNFDDTAKIKSSVLEMFDRFLVNRNNIQSENIERYSMANLSRNYTNLFNQVISAASSSKQQTK